MIPLIPSGLTPTATQRVGVAHDTNDNGPPAARVGLGLGTTNHVPTAPAGAETVAMPPKNSPKTGAALRLTHWGLSLGDNRHHPYLIPSNAYAA